MKTEYAISGSTPVSPSAIRLHTFSRLARRLALLGICAAFAAAAQAQTFTLLHSFTGAPDGQYPGSGVLDVSGTLYGTTAYGGTGNCTSQGISGCGTVYTVKTSGSNYKVLYSFTGAPDGYGPGFGTLVSDGAGNYYGTTIAGGTGSCKDETGVVGCGTVFKITSAGKESVIYSFQGGTKDGWGPLGGVVRDSQGNLYGTTAYGGSGKCSDTATYTGCGIVFKVTSAGVESVLHDFKGGSDGETPFAGLVMDSSDNLYGTTLLGGGKNDAGVVFKVTSSGTESVIYRFSVNDLANGLSPFAPLAIDSANILYGTTTSGGSCGSESFCGVIFKMTTAGKLTVLYDFAGGVGDGDFPYAGLTLDSSGNLYGSTQGGGTDDYGVVFELKDGAATDNVLWNFNGTTEGNSPFGTLAVDSKGDIYGTNSQGGKTTCGGGMGCGTVYKVVP